MTDAVPARLRSNLSRTDWNDLERALEIANRNPRGGSVRVGKVSITVSCFSVARNTKPPVNHPAPRSAARAETPRPSSNRQRKSTARQRTFIARKKVIAGALKAMLRHYRWLRMQEVWTAFMRDSVHQQPSQTSVVVTSDSIESMESDLPTDIRGTKRSPGSRSWKTFTSAQLSLQESPQRLHASSARSPVGSSPGATTTPQPKKTRGRTPLDQPATLTFESGAWPRLPLT